ncbi:flagellar protein FliT [Rhodanobacter sp. AS-Z3]|uniref:flagellar protein FliT n=1 Tax=Rhodanobacter sp. AS-Z3 TaxID=3031330 RepID=UPI00247B2AAD|nr:flagellar protein FliT [Rhodanobacter sp. AS-Z3]WEN14615.1 flagellar protein FliT [Rhodanobacter sp. AS-Z3]
MKPSASDSESPLTQALVMTHAMLQAAKQSDWEQLRRLEDQREPLLHREHPADDVSRAQIGEVLASDRQLQVLLATARDAVAAQWQDDRGRARAIAAYEQP